MHIVGGLDIHRKQITLDYLDTSTGQVHRGQVSPADQVHLRAWLGRFAGLEDVEFAVEGCSGWRYVTEELAAAGITAHLAETADTAFARGCKRHAKTDRTDCRSMRMLLAEGRLTECWIAHGHILECRALLELYQDLRAEHTPGCSGSTRCCSTRALRHWVRVRCAASRAWARCGRRRRASVHGRAAADRHALEVTEALENRLHAVRHRCWPRPGIWQARRCWPRGYTG